MSIKYSVSPSRARKRELTFYYDNGKVYLSVTATLSRVSSWRRISKVITLKCLLFFKCEEKRGRKEEGTQSRKLINAVIEREEENMPDGKYLLAATISKKHRESVAVPITTHFMASMCNCNGRSLA